MPDVTQQFNGGIILYLDMIDEEWEGAPCQPQERIDKAYRAVCQTLNALNRVRMEWQKTQRKQKDTPNA